MSYKAGKTTVMLLAAGHGKRMLPLTQDTPKPLLKVNGISLIEYHLLALSKAGFKQIVINVAYLGEQIVAALGDGGNYGLEITYSNEIKQGPLETAGGIKYALPLIKSDPFLVVNADIWTDFDFNDALKELTTDARLVMVNNPDHNKQGDFSLSHGSKVLTRGADCIESHTFSGIALYRKKVFRQLAEGALPLAPTFNSLIENNNIEGQVHDGVWEDIGTPERLSSLAQRLRQ